MRWTEIDPATRQHLSAGDTCYAYGERKPGGYSQGETNQLIENLKKAPTASPVELAYKAAAIERCAHIIANAIKPEHALGVTLVAAPPSGVRGAPDYDDRMQKVCRRAVQLNPSLEFQDLVVGTKACTPAHKAKGTPRHPDEVRKRIALTNGAAQVRSTVVIVDDVLTSGATFVAVKDLVSTLPGCVEVGGLFIAAQVYS